MPQHRVLYEILRKHIEDGVYVKGDLLPSENDLCHTHNCTRPTVRQALNSLVTDGFIMKQQGKGSIVNELPTDIGILSIGGTTSAVGNKDLKTEIIVKPIIKPWEDPFMFPLSEFEKESGCIYLERLRLLDNRPLFYDITFLPNINLPRFTALQLKDKSLFSMLRKQFALEVKGGEQRLKAISSNKKVSRYLDIKTNKPVLNLERKIATNRPNYFFYSRLYCNTENNAIYGTF